MKHLKRFNENLSLEELKDIQREFEEYLTYLLDSNTNITTFMDIFSDKYTFSILVKNFGEHFYWEDIKYDFLPLLYLISKKYKIVSLTSDDPTIAFIKYTDNGDRTILLTLDSILNRNTIDEEKEVYNGVTEPIKLKQVYFYFRKN